MSMIDDIYLIADSLGLDPEDEYDLQELAEEINVDEIRLERWIATGSTSASERQSYADDIKEYADSIRQDSASLSDASRTRFRREKEGRRDSIEEARDKGTISQSRYEAEMDYFDEEYDEEEYDELSDAFYRALETGASEDWRAFRDLGGDRNTP